MFTTHFLILGSEWSLIISIKEVFVINLPTFNSWSTEKILGYETLKIFGSLALLQVD